MDAPICSVCQENDELCDECQELVDDGDVSETAVEVSRLLHDISKDISTLEDVEIQQVKHATDAIVIITGNGDGPKVVGKNGEVVKQLAEHFDTSIRVVENSGKDKEVIENLLEPVPVQNINTVYKPDGTEKKVIVDSGDERRVPISREDFREIVLELTGNEYSLSFE